MRVWLTRFIACSVLSSVPAFAQDANNGSANSSTNAKLDKESCSENCTCDGTESIAKGSPDISSETKRHVNDQSPKNVTGVYFEAESSSTPNEWFLSDMLGSWLKTPVRFKTEVAVHFASDEGTGDSKNLIATVCLENAEQDNKVVRDAKSERGEGEAKLNVKPLVFTTGFEKLVEDVIACGHRICTGNKCYEVKDEPVVGDDCSTPENKEEEEPIMVVPAAPPAPPAMLFTENDRNMPSNGVALDENVIKDLQIAGPAKAVMNLLVDNARLSARLELTETLMAERQAAMEQIYALAEKNARLQTQIAVNEARQHATEQLTASLIDRTEWAMKLVAMRTEGSTESCEVKDSSATLKSIQEDLSNIRRQIALMKKQAPVPFAPSNVGRVQVQPYVPSLQQHPSTESSDPAIAREPHGTSKY